MSIIYELLHDKNNWSYILTVDMPRKLTKPEIKAINDLTSTISTTIKILNLKTGGIFDEEKNRKQ
jgi:hypothetical protein